MYIKIEKSWKNALRSEFSKPYFKKLVGFLRSEYLQNTIYPPGAKIFNAFDHCSLDDLKVIVIGQDPYHGPGQANGLSFSVADGVRKPPSLLNIFKEIKSDIGNEIPISGNLERWADQGVLLLNATLTVRAKEAGSHQGNGWEEFTDEVIKIISEKKMNIVFLLWGSFAKKKEYLISKNNGHLILSSAHPSPFSADKGFFGNKHFSKTNDFLKKHGLKEIEW